MTTLVCYHIPSDKDEVDHPNAFTIRKSPEDITLRDIRSTFPLPGDYHFRFKVKLESGSYWMDFTDDNEFVPVYAPRRILIKALRISWTKQRTIENSERNEIPKNQGASRSSMLPDSGMDLFGGNISMSTSTGGKGTAGGNHVSDLDLFS